MSWHPIKVIRDDKNWLTRTVEKSVSTKLCEKLNELEQATGGKVYTTVVLAIKEGEYIELAVSINDGTNPTS